MKKKRWAIIVGAPKKKYWGKHIERGLLPMVVENCGKICDTFNTRAEARLAIKEWNSAESWHYCIKKL
jgi:hypothetical protein